VSVATIRKVGLVTLLCWGRHLGAESRNRIPDAGDAGADADGDGQRRGMATGSSWPEPDRAVPVRAGRPGRLRLVDEPPSAWRSARPARKGLKKAVLRHEHLIDTVVESVAHKIYDSFSQASRPDLTVRKERAVETLCRQVFKPAVLQRCRAPRRRRREPNLLPPFATSLQADFKQLHEAFTQAGVVADEDVNRWLNFARNLQPGAENLFSSLQAYKFLVEADPDDGLGAGVRARQRRCLARKLANLDASS